MTRYDVSLVIDENGVGEAKLLDGFSDKANLSLAVGSRISRGGLRSARNTFSIAFADAFIGSSFRPRFRKRSRDHACTSVM